MSFLSSFRARGQSTVVEYSFTLAAETTQLQKLPDLCMDALTQMTLELQPPHPELQNFDELLKVA